MCRWGRQRLAMARQVSPGRARAATTTAATAEPPKAAYSMAEYAKLMGVSLSTVKRLRAEKKLPGVVTLGRRVLIPAAAVERQLAAK